MSADIVIRSAVASDAEALAQLGQATFLETFAGVLDGAAILAHNRRQHTSAIYREYLAQAGSRLWLAEAMPGHAAVGYLLLTPSALPLDDLQADDLEVKRVYLLHRFQGGGLGWRLMQQAIEHARSAGSRRLLLGVYLHNVSAQAFYQRQGFQPLGTRLFRVGERDYEDRIFGLAL